MQHQQLRCLDRGAAIEGPEVTNKDAGQDFFLTGKKPRRLCIHTAYTEKAPEERTTRELKVIHSPRCTRRIQVQLTSLKSK